jgi:peptide/nickel transport system permease protein
MRARGESALPAETLRLPAPRGRAWRSTHGVLRFARRRPLGAVSALIIVILLFMAVFAPVIAPYSYDHQVLADRLQNPSREHLLGTDNLGRDIFSRVVYGARISVTIGFTAVVISTLVNMLLGIPSGYFGGRIDLGVQRLVDVWQAMPGLVALIFFITVFGPSLVNLTLLLGVLGVGGSRVIRSAVLSVRHMDYVEAARAIGATDARIMLVHVTPNVVHVIIIGATISVGGFILAEAGLAFLGLGVPPPFPTWGRMLNVSREYLTFPWIALGPGLALTAAVFAFNVFGDALRDVLDPRLRGAH